MRSREHDALAALINRVTLPPDKAQVPTVTRSPGMSPMI